MVNKVEIAITAHDKTEPVFAAARANATKAGKAYADAYKAEVIKGTRGVGTRVSKQVSTEMISGSKGTGEKVSKQFTDGLLAGTKETGGRVADKFTETILAKTDGTGDKAGKRFSSEFTKATKGLGRATGTDIGVGLNTSITAGAKGAGVRAGKQIDEEIVKGTKDTGVKVGKQIGDGLPKASGKAGKDAGITFRSAFAGNSGGNDLVDVLFKGGGALAGAAGGSVGIAIGAAVAGGLSTALVGGGVVGLAGLLLKDNEKVSKAWGTTWEGITEDAKRRAGILEDEFVAGAGATAQAWETKLGPALERTFKNAEPLVDDFIAMPTNWIAALAPGVEKAVANAGPAVEGLDKMGTAIFKGLGDGLGELSEHSGDLKVAMEMIGEGVGKTLEGTLSFVGDLSKKVADNEAAWRSWGDKVSKVAGVAGEEIGRLVDVAAALGDPGGKNAKGDSIGKSLGKLLMGDDYADPVKGDYNDVRNLPQLGERVGRTLGNAVDAVKNPVDMVTETKAVKGSVLDSELKLLAARKELNEATDKANYLDSIGLANSQGRINAGLQISQSQAQLIESGNLLTQVTGNNTQANQQYIAAINGLSAAGMPASDALLGMVGGMNSAELAALGATVTMDGLGNAVVAIPGQKEVVIDAATLAANNNIDGVQANVDSLTGKVVYIDIITRNTTIYSAIGSSSAGSTGTGGREAVGYGSGYNKGGLIPGAGPDVDSKTIAVTPGEFVVNRKATGENLSMLKALNEGAGGDTVMAMMGTGTGRGSSVIEQYSRGGDTASSGWGAPPTVVVKPQINFEFGHASFGMFDQRAFLSWVANALQTTGGMQVNGWKA